MDNNCPNCGAVFQIEKSKCPYCGTSYFDMTTLQLDSEKPVFLKFKTSVSGKKYVITGLVKVCAFTSFRNDQNIATSGLGTAIIQSYSPQIEFDLSFKSVPSIINKQNVLFLCEEQINE